jgi:uncharacterized surface protein with fasciclin (FAS1) repeats
MRLRNILIMLLLAMVATMPLVALGNQENGDPPPQQQPQQDPQAQEPEAQEAEEEDPWAEDEDDAWEAEEEEPLDPDAEEPVAETEEEDPLATEDEELADVDTQAQPGDAEDETALDVISEHARTSIAFDLFGEEFADALGGGEQLAIFVPADDVLEGMAREDLSDEEIRSLYERHVATGLASEEPIEFIESFATVDGQMISVTVEEDGTVVLNGTARIVEVIPVTNGIVYIIDGTLDW